MSWLRNIGAKVVLKEVDRCLYLQRGRANECDVRVWPHGQTREFAMRYSRAFRFLPAASASEFGVPWGKWYDTGGKAGEEPPEKIKKLFNVVEKWIVTLSGTEEYMRLGREILAINVKNLYRIGVVALSPQPVVIKNNLRNTPNAGSWACSYGNLAKFVAKIKQK